MPPAAKHSGRHKGRPLLRIRQARAGVRCPSYGLIAAADLAKFVFNSVPTDCTASMIATAMPAAIRTYSMAVAPDSLLIKRQIKLIIGSLHLQVTPYLSSERP